MPRNSKTALTGRLLGEFVVVVVGILLALAVDQAVDTRAAASSEVEYLRELRSDVGRDVEWFDSFRANLDERERGISELTNVLEEDGAAAMSTSDLAAMVDRVFNLRSYPATTTTFDDLVATGNLKLMSDRALRRDVIDYYRWTDHWIGGSESRRLDALGPIASDIQVALGHDYSRGEPSERANRIRRHVLRLSPTARARVLDGLARLAVYSQWQGLVYGELDDRLLKLEESLDRALADS